MIFFKTVSLFFDSYLTWAKHFENKMNQVYVFDFTAPVEEKLDEGPIKLWCKQWCKKWVFQKEQAASGYLHYQGRVSMKAKVRLSTLIAQEDNIAGVHWSVTHNKSRNDVFYVTKVETRVDGPWSSRDKPVYIPRHISKINEWYPWQQSLIDISAVRDDRHINVVYDRVGNNGKTTVALWLMLHKKARMLPYCNDFKELMEMAYGTPTSEVYIIDLPRAINKGKLKGLFSGIEQIKNGWVFDRRYQFKEKFFDAPVIWVFSNAEIDTRLLSVDRWIFWTINGRELVRLDDAEMRPPVIPRIRQSAMEIDDSDLDLPPDFGIDLGLMSDNSMEDL